VFGKEWADAVFEVTKKGRLLAVNQCETC
jgi:hypothetical protein